jgi:hypothetical protein
MRRRFGHLRLKENFTTFVVVEAYIEKHHLSHVPHPLTTMLTTVAFGILLCLATVSRGDICSRYVSSAKPQSIPYSPLSEKLNLS